MIPDQVEYVRLEPDGLLPDVTSFAPFKAVVVIEGTYSPEWQDKVSRWLVDQGCLYMMAWGPDCSSWDDSVDYANMFAHADYEIPDDKFVMTTWHEKESLESVFWYAQFCAQLSYNDQELTNALIVHISEIDRKGWMMALVIRSLTLADREPD